MTQKIRMWEVTPDQKLSEIPNDQISLEKRLEEWLESDISVLDPDLLVIGRQVRTDFGGFIDLLCLEGSGDTVVIELKVGTTPWSVTSQVLDYVTWVKDLSVERIRNIAESYQRLDGTLEQTFREKFGQPLPDTLNEGHRSLIVAENTDATTERIVRYLSDFSVPISLATVQHFSGRDGQELLAQVFLVEPKASQPGPKRTSIYSTVNGLQALADESGVGSLYRRIREGVRRILYATPYVNSVGYYRQLDDGGTRTVMFVDAYSENGDGGIGFTIHATRFNNYFGIGLQEMKALLPEDCWESTSVRNWRGSSQEERESAVDLKGYFRTSEEVDKFIAGLRASIE